MNIHINMPWHTYFRFVLEPTSRVHKGDIKSLNPEFALYCSKLSEVSTRVVTFQCRLHFFVILNKITSQLDLPLVSRWPGPALDPRDPGAPGVSGL